MKPSPPTETNDSCRDAPAGVLFFEGAILIVILVIVGAVCCALLIRWIVKGPLPPPATVGNDD